MDTRWKSDGAANLSVFSRPDLLALGFNDSDIRRRLIRRDWSAARPGMYYASHQGASVFPDVRHRALVRSLLPRLADGSVLSHASAATLLGLPIWNVDLSRVHVTRPAYHGANRTAGVHVHEARADGIPSILVDGMLVTTVARTVIDSARTVPFEQGVVLADAALHSSLVTHAELANEVHLAKRRYGASRARRVMEFADERSESVGESRSRVLFARSGLPKMEPQFEILNHSGSLVAHVDFAIPELRIAGEFDGKVKYGALLKPGQSASDVVFEEKRREDAIRALDWGMVRWVWDELEMEGTVAGRWRRAIAQARPVRA